ncbi:glycosyltransferase [Burkholderia pyrrocinia]
MDNLSCQGAARSGRRLIYFSSVTYASYAQRPHFMVEAFAADGFDAVLWVDPYPTRFPSLADLTRQRPRSHALGGADDARITVVRPRALPIEPMPMSGWVNRVVAWRTICAQLRAFARDTDHCVIAVGRPSKMAQWALETLPHQRSFIDVLDHFPAFYHGLSRLSMQSRLYAICRHVTDVYCSSYQIAAAISTMRRDAIIVPNGCASGELPAPSSASTRRYIGYVGTIAHWFDWPLVCSLARALPDVTVRLIGPEFIARPTGLPANIELLGERPHPEIAELVREFAVGLIPFRISELTSGVDPIKFYEYRSMGVPVWSTAFGEMSSRGDREGVTRISRNADWPRLWADAQALAPSLDEIESFRAEVDWNKRFEPVLTRSKMVESIP